jgi:hypothetical protein
MTSIIIRSPRESSSEAPQPIATRPLSSPWRWMVAACLILGISGGIRFWRERQFAILAEESSSPPFRMDELPRILGDWRSEPAMDDRLEAEISQIAGANDYVVRTYLNEKTGDQMSALVIYGLARKVYGHKPEVCYPAAGYQLVAGPVDRELKVPGLKDPVQYRWAIYMKRVGGIGVYQETYHTFYYDGKWNQDTANQWKLFRYRPAMFKIQLARTVSGLSDEVNGPSEALLGAIVQEITSRATSRASETGKAGPAGGTAAPGSTGPRGAGTG